jgi:hypothetical protein
MATQCTPGTPDSDLKQVVWSLLCGAEEPWTASQLSSRLEGSLKRLSRQLPALLDEQARAGRLVRFAPFRGKAPRYWTRDHASYARGLIQGALSEKPRKSSDLEKAIAKRLGDLTKAQRQAILDQMVAEEKVYRLPNLPGSRTPRYSLAPPDPRDYLRTPMNRLRRQVERLAQTLASFGVTPEQTFSAAVELLGWKAADAAAQSAATRAHAWSAAVARADFAAAFDAAFHDLDRQRGSHNFVSLVELRQALARFPREQFDRGLRDLRSAGLYGLSAAEGIHGIRPEDRDAGIEEAGTLLLYVSKRI